MRITICVFIFIFIFQFTSGLIAQDTLYGTISVKKNKKIIKSMTVYTYPLVKSKDNAAVKTEFFKYNENGNVFLHSNFYNHTNETYEYDSTKNLVFINVFDTYLKTYMYKDTFEYDEKGRLILKARFSYNKFNVGRRDITPLTKSTNINYVPEGTVFVEEYKYDAEGKLIYKCNKRTTQSSYFTYKYDSAGNQVEERAVSARKRDSLGVQVIDSLVVIGSTKYDSYSDPVSYVSKNVRGEIFNTDINKYDTKGRKTETQVFDGSFMLKQKFLFSYDAGGKMTEQLYFDYAPDKNNKPIQRSETKIRYEYEMY